MSRQTLLDTRRRRGPALGRGAARRPRMPAPVNKTATLLYLHLQLRDGSCIEIRPDKKVSPLRAIQVQGGNTQAEHLRHRKAVLWATSRIGIRIVPQFSSGSLAAHISLCRDDANRQRPGARALERGPETLDSVVDPRVLVLAMQNFEQRNRRRDRLWVERGQGDARHGIPLSQRERSEFVDQARFQIEQELIAAQQQAARS
jgi:hypothetical protein